jgi:hypothetical protein
MPTNAVVSRLRRRPAAPAAVLIAAGAAAHPVFVLSSQDRRHPSHRVTYAKGLATLPTGCLSRGPRRLAGSSQRYLRAAGVAEARKAPWGNQHERYNRILAEEFLYAREWTSEHQRSAALSVWNIHYNTRVTNVMASYS